MKLPKLTLSDKINLYTAVLFIILLIIMNIFIYYLFSRMTIESEKDRAHTEAELVVKGMNESVGIIPQGDLLRSYVPADGMIRIVTADLQGPPPVTSPTEKELPKRPVTYYVDERVETIEFAGKKYTFVSMPVIWEKGEVVNLQLFNSLQREVNNLKTLRLVLLIVTLAVIIPVLISTRFLSKLITTPITSLIQTMRQIRESGEFRRINVRGESKDELAMMGETFNHMIDILESNAKKQAQFASNASHELKTPLTIISSYASLLKRRGRTEPEVFEEAVEAIHSESIRMKEMTEQLLLLAKPNESWIIEKEPLSLDELLTGLKKSFEKTYKREIILNIDEKVTLETDKQKLNQLLYIFLDNARKYSEEVITVNVGMKDHLPFLQILDRGMGIPKEELSKVFDRFYRVDKARSRKLGGTGLGLSLAKELADALNIKLEMDSIEGMGTTVTLFFEKEGGKK